ncbi:MAG: aminotransferase class V-fold PLP-dependent enzyme [Gemmatimonadota bacterium]
MIYLDNAASSWPKPEAVVERTQAWVADNGANPGRSNHRPARRAGRRVREARARLADLLGVDDPSRVILTASATHALNLALHGTLGRGGHVVTTLLEHNSVLRPLAHLEDTRGVEVSAVAPEGDGRVRPTAVAAEVRPDTRLVAVNHASNLLGTVQPVPEIVRAVREEAGERVAVLVDAAQTAGVLDLPVRAWDVDLLAVAGHKGLFGLQGTGALWVGPRVDLPPLMPGGTGTRSHEARQPDAMPERLEAGTPNTPGLVALAEGLRFLEETGIREVRRHEDGLRRQMVEGLRAIEGVEVHGPPASDDDAVAVVAFDLGRADPVEAAFLYDRRYDVAVRAGLHCAPWAHRWLGTLERQPQGAIRASPGWFTTGDDISAFLEATRELASEMAAATPA